MTEELALAADPGFIERSADPGEFIIQACERARTWLREALDNGEIDQIAEVKSQAEAVRVYTMQKQLGKDAQLSATEIVRRAERGIGVAIRRGQAAGEIRGRHQGKRTQRAVGNGPLRSPTEFASQHELSPGGSDQAGIYDLTDGVSDDDFEGAVCDAKAEGSLSRANVARKARARSRAKAKEPGEWVPAGGDNHGDAPVQRRKLMRDWAAQGYTSRQMGERLGMRDDSVRKIARDCGIEIPADKLTSGTRRHDSARIARETTHALEGLAMGVELIDFADLSPAEAKDWAASLAASTRILSRFARQMKEITQ
jgi:hypothetical protein